MSHSRHSPPEHVHQVTGRKCCHRHDPKTQNDIKHCFVVSNTDVPEINEDDPKSVESVEHNRTDQSDFGYSHERGLIRANHGVVSERRGSPPNTAKPNDEDAKSGIQPSYIARTMHTQHLTGLPVEQERIPVVTAAV